MTINLTQLIADREAGTPGDWRIVQYDAGDDRVPCNTPMIDGPEEYDCAVVHWDGFKQKYWASAHGDERAISANARRIARVPELEAALLDAMETMERIAAEAYVSIDEDYPMSWRGVAVERIDIARSFLERFK